MPSEWGRAWTTGDVASGWQRGTATRVRALGPVTERLLDLAGVTEGSRVLDLGTGTGEQAIVAARRVGPSGVVLATDISPAMLEIARAAARDAQLGNVQNRIMDAQHLDLESASFDAAIARFSLQFVPDVPRALAEVRRVLKPGGRFAAVVFSTVESNLFRAAPQAIASRLAGRQFPEPGPGQWALNDRGVLAGEFQRAGFRDVEVHTVPFVYAFESLADALRNLEESQPMLMTLLGELPVSDRAAAWTEIEQSLQPCVTPDGFRGPAEALVASGTA